MIVTLGLPLKKIRAQVLSPNRFQMEYRVKPKNKMLEEENRILYHYEWERAQKSEAICRKKRMNLIPSDFKNVCVTNYIISKKWPR